MRAIHHRPIYSRYHGLAASGFVFGIVYGIFSLSLPLLGENLVANAAFLGFIFAIPELLGMALDVPIGAFANRFGRRRTILASGFLLIAAAFAFIWLRHPVWFVITLLFYEVATQSYIIPANAEVMALSPSRRAGRFNGLVEGFHNFGFAFGPLIAGVLLGRSADGPFWAAAIFALGMIALSVEFLPSESGKMGAVQAVDHVWRRDRVFRKSLAELTTLGFDAVYSAFLMFAFALHWGFIALLEPIYADQLGLSPLLIGVVYAGFSIPYVFVSVLAGRYLDRSGAKGVMVAGLALIAVSLFGFGIAHDARSLFLFSLVSGIGDALLLPAVMSTFDRLSAYHSKERIAGIEVFAESTGYFFGPLIAGVVTSLIGFSSTFLAIGSAFGGLALVTALVPFGWRVRTRS